MPDIDVSEVLLSSDIAAQPFVVVRRQTTVDGHGRAQVTEPRFGPDQGCVGAVQPEDSPLVREEGYQAALDAIAVVTSFRLRGPAKNPDQTEWMPDIVLWDGNSYVVESINDYATFGGGTLEARCVSIDYMDTSPT